MSYIFILVHLCVLCCWPEVLGGPRNAQISI
ncbi:hypothetical protein GLYMA_19G085232v4 [Glycine max]|nr:hypothetical protein GLYMA_19G085232v4 [Glycine max]KAH1076930.1 hypothetical protein GYH30_052442 [Glycine max]